MRQKLKFVCGVWVLFRENVCVSGCVCVKDKERERKEGSERGLTFKVYFKCRTIAKKIFHLTLKCCRKEICTTLDQQQQENTNLT